MGILGQRQTVWRRPQSLASEGQTVCAHQRLAVSTSQQCAAAEEEREEEVHSTALPQEHSNCPPAQGPPARSGLASVGSSWGGPSAAGHRCTCLRPNAHATMGRQLVQMHFTPCRASGLSGLGLPLLPGHQGMWSPGKVAEPWKCACPRRASGPTGLAARTIPQGCLGWGAASLARPRVASRHAAASAVRPQSAKPPRCLAQPTPRRVAMDLSHPRGCRGWGAASLAPHLVASGK